MSPEQLPEPVPKVFDKDPEGLRELILRRRRLVEQRTAEKNRLQTVMFDIARKRLQRYVKESGLETERIEKALLTLVANDDSGQGNHNAMCVVAVPASAARRTWRPSARSRTTR
jgi:transposase